MKRTLQDKFAYYKVLAFKDEVIVFDLCIPIDVAVLPDKNDGIKIKEACGKEFENDPRYGFLISKTEKEDGTFEHSCWALSGHVVAK